MTVPLSLARRSVTHGANASPADVPLNGAATWDPAHGLRLWDALDQAALWVVSNAGARIIAVGNRVNRRTVDLGDGRKVTMAGLSMEEEARLLAEARLAGVTVR